MGQITVERNVDGIEGLCVITPAVHGDARGYFMETYSARDMADAGFDIVFVQDNQSMSTKGVLRGLHFQKQFPQSKLVRVIKGEVYDVAVDLRANSATYGKWHISKEFVAFQDAFTAVLDKREINQEDIINCSKKSYKSIMDLLRTYEGDQ